MPAKLLPARLILALALVALAPFGAAHSQSIDGTWILFDNAGDPELARLVAAGATLPREQLEQTRRIEFSGTTATVHAAGTVVTIALEPEIAAWGVDARVVSIEGTEAPITFLRIEFGEPGRATLTTFRDQILLERFAMLSIRPTP